MLCCSDTDLLDTTAVGILANIGNIIANSSVKQKLQREIDQAYLDLGLGNDARELAFKEVEKLPYLTAVINESTRLHPSIQYQLPRQVPDEGVQLGPYFVPGGLSCGISPKTMNRSKEIFGPDADLFWPERWIATSPEHDERIKFQLSQLTTVSVAVSGLTKPFANLISSMAWEAEAVLAETLQR